jgi:hypothetical protein
MRSCGKAARAARTGYKLARIAAEQAADNTSPFILHAPPPAVPSADSERDNDL